MTSIQSISYAPRYVPAPVGPSPNEDERERLRSLAKGGGSSDPRVSSNPGYMPSLGGYGGGSAFFVQSIASGSAPGGAGPGAPGGSVGGGAGPIGGNDGGTDDGSGTGGGTGPVGPGGGTGPVDGGGGGVPSGPTMYSMRSGDGFDLFTGNVIQGASSFPADSGLSTGDFQLSADGAGGVSFTLGSGMGLPLQVSIQRGTSYDSVTSAEGASYGNGGSPIAIGPGDTVIVDYGGFMNYAIGNVRQEADGSIGFDAKEIPASPPAPVDMRTQALDAMHVEAPTADEQAIASTSPDASPEAQAAAATVWGAQMAVAAYAAASMLASVSGGSVGSEGTVSTAGGGTPGISSSGPTGGAAASSGSSSASSGGASSGGTSGGSSGGSSASTSA